MAFEITIDAAGRLIIPKPLRRRLALRAGARLTLSEEEGRLILTPDRPAPRLVEHEGFLRVDLGPDAPEVDAAPARDERLRSLVEYALRR